MADALNLQDLMVRKRVEEEHQYTFVVEVHAPKPEKQCCLFCDQVKNGTKSQNFRDLPMHGKFVDVLVKRQRFKCRRCNEVTYAKVPNLDTAHRMTKRLAEHIYEASFKRTFADVGREVGLAEGTIRNVFNARANVKLKGFMFETPRVLGIDEKKLMGGYRCVLGNVEQGTIVDLLSNRYKHNLNEYLSTLRDKQRVEVVCMDMWPTYRELARAHFPKATIIADKFHVVRMGNDAMETIRKEIRRTLPEQRRIKMKDERWTLLKREANWTDRDRKRFDQWRTEFPELVEVYKVKEEFFDIFDSSENKEVAQRRYIAWQENLPDAYRFLFRPITTAMNNWGGAAFAYFDHGYTNAYVEGLNHLIGDINRMGRGYSFEVLRAKAMLAYGQKKEEKRFKRMPRGDVLMMPSISFQREYGMPLSTLREALEEGLLAA